MGYGAMSTEELVDELAQRGFKTAVITDINSTAGVIEFARLAEKRGMKPVAGIDFRNDIDQQFLAIAKNQDGFAAINETLSAILASQMETPSKWAFAGIFPPKTLHLEPPLPRTSEKPQGRLPAIFPTVK
ncbi:PHP domain-containing protein [bacterium]|nr:PHP domain-containing protein [bacterium]